MGRSLLKSVAIAALVMLAPATSFADGARLGENMMALFKGLSAIAYPDTHPDAKPLDEVKAMRTAAQDCVDHAAEYASKEVAEDPVLLKAFKGAFELLVTQIDALEAALTLPANAPDRKLRLDQAIADIKKTRDQGHDYFL